MSPCLPLLAALLSLLPGPALPQIRPPTRTSHADRFVASETSRTQAAKARLYSFLRAKYIKRYSEERNVPLDEAFKRQDEILQDSHDFAREAEALGLDPRDPPQDVPDVPPPPRPSPRRVFLEEEEEFLVRDDPGNQDFGDYPEGECSNCVDDSLPDINKYAMPIFKYKEKRYYLGIFFKANWFRANQYCRYHGMHLASISSQEENDKLEETIRDFGYSFEHFWVSGTDLAEEGQFFWMSTGRPITFTNWNAGEPNNFRYENGEEENCLELWDRDGKGLKWNDSACSFETYFVCEAVP